MKHHRLFTFPLAVAALAATATDAKPLNLRYEGATSATEIDIDDDGIPGGLAIGRGRGTLGPISTHIVFDTVPVPTTNCAPGEFESLFVVSSNVIQDQSGNQLFLQIQSGFLCVDASLGQFQISLEEVIVGGTGRFAGASGQVQTRCSGVLLVPDLTPAGPRVGHAAFSCRSQGELD